MTAIHSTVFPNDLRGMRVSVLHEKTKNCALVQSNAAVWVLGLTTTQSVAHTWFM